MEAADISAPHLARFNEDLERVRSKVLGMGGFVEEQLSRSADGADRWRQLARTGGRPG